MADLGLQVCSETCALSCTLPSGDNETTEDQRSECRAYTKLFQALFDYFGHCIFRDGQMESLLPLLHGNLGCVYSNGNWSWEVFMHFFRSSLLR
jgi:hypothetical protein